ncbi:MAG: helix-turn-helix domain-containing protein [Bacteroidales bacterium]
MKPAELLRMVRLKEAASMFRSGYDNVAQVMYRVGFNNQSHFSRIFRKEFFMNPSEYIRKNKDK